VEDSLAELHEEFYIIKPTFSLFLNGESKQPLSVNDKWCCIILAAGIITLICTIYFCMQRLCGASFLNYELLLEKLTHYEQHKLNKK
jgi:hypothetical protein